MVTKEFSSRIMRNNEVAIKYESNKVNKGNKVIIASIYGLNQRLECLNPWTVHEKALVPVASMNDSGLSDFIFGLQNKKRMYFPLQLTTYLAYVRVIVENGQVIEQQIHLFLPAGFSKEALIGKNITNTFTPEIRKALAANLTPITLQTSELML